MKRNFLFLSIVLICTACSTARKDFNPGKKYSPRQLHEDFSVLQKVLTANHPSLYWYASKDSIDGYFKETLEGLQDSLTEQQFRNRIAWMLNKIHCGHTAVRASKQFSSAFVRLKLPQFPLAIKTWDDSSVVINNFSKTDSSIRRGTIITAINRVSMKQIIDSISEFISTDGYSNIFKYQAISFNFPAYYRNTFGIDSEYTVKYIDSLGELKEHVLKNIYPLSDSLSNPERQFPDRFTKRELRKLALINSRNLKIDTPLNTAIITVNTFNSGKLNSFFRRSFKKIRNSQIKNLILDLRINTGGDILSATRLSQYLIDKPFHVADTVAAFGRSFKERKYIKPWFIYWLSMHISGKRSEDKNIHFRYFEKHQFKPKERNHFNGNVYILTSGYTFSASTLLIGNLKGQPNIIIAGEETGGGAYGNSAVHITTIVLPNTGVRATLPLYRMVLNSRLSKNGRGIFPDVEVKPSSQYLELGIDRKMEKVRELIKEK